MGANKHTDETKALQAMINALRESLGYTPLFEFTGEGESDRKKRNPRDRSEKTMKQSEIVIGQTYYAKVDGVLEKVVVICRDEAPEHRVAHFFIQKIGDCKMLPKARSAAALRATRCKGPAPKNPFPSKEEPSLSEEEDLESCMLATGNKNIPL